MTDADSIKLAEFCGWRWEPLEKPSTNTGKWYPPESSPIYQGPDDFIYGKDKPDLVFTPHTDANDCEALIRALNEAGYNVDISIRRNGKHSVRIIMGHEPVFVDNDDYKQGVCELALKVLDGNGRGSDEDGRDSDDRGQKE